MKSVVEMADAKRAGRKIVMVTAYDFWSARLITAGTADCILVGDSVMMVVHGHEDTLGATPELMELHTRAVAKGGPAGFIVADMPFLSARRGQNAALDCAAGLLRAGAAAVKIEGIRGNAEVVRHLVDSGVPVMGHLGLTPQWLRTFGGFKVQARHPDAAAQLLADAREFQDAGAFALVLECVPSAVARDVTAALGIPVIGIGAGPDCDGQVLVLHDLLGLLADFQPRFARRFVEGGELVANGLARFSKAVREGTFPVAAESFS